MQPRELIQKIQQAFGGAITTVSEEVAFPHIVVKTSSLKSVLSFCVQDASMRFDFLECLSGVDTGKEIIVLYQLFSTGLVHRLNIKTVLSRESPKIMSVTEVWPAAICYELEAAEMFGIHFDGHPRMRPLLLPPDWLGHPLRKDYVFAEEFQGIEHRRTPLLKEHVRP